MNNYYEGNNYSESNNNVNKNKKTLTASTMTVVAIVLLLISSAVTTAAFSQTQQQTNTPPVLTVPASTLDLGVRTGTTATTAVVLASYVSASDREDGSLSSQIQCSSATNSLRPATSTFNFPAGITIVTCSVSDNGIKNENNQPVPNTVLTVQKQFTVTSTHYEGDENNERATTNRGNIIDTPHVQQQADTTAPVTSIYAGSVQNNGLTSIRTATFMVGGTDAGGIADYECIIDERPINPCENPVSFSGLGDGIHSFVAAAIDKAGNKDATPEQIVWEIDATAPVISGMPTQGPLPVIATGKTGGKITYSPPTATDVRDGSRTVTCSPAPGTTITTGVGTTGTGTCISTDLAGNIATKAFGYKVVWPTTIFPLSPINTADGTTKFIVGGTIPVKFKVDPVPEFGYVTEIKAKIFFAKTDSTIPTGGTIVTGLSAAAASSGNEFKYSTNGEYIFNWGTESATAGQGKYQIIVDFGDGTKKSILISLVNPNEIQ